MTAVDTALFKPELTFIDFEARDRFDLFARLGERLAPAGYIRDGWLDAILERERRYPTGLDCGPIRVAIPHVEPRHIARPYIAVIRPARPIEFEGMAGLPAVQAELIVNLGLQGHEDSQVKALQALMGLFADTAAVRDISRQTTPDGLLSALLRRIG